MLCRESANLLLRKPREMADTQKLFFALWPGDKQRQTLAEIQNDLKLAEFSRCTSPEKLHITLHFLGEVQSARIPDLVEFVEETRFEPFHFDLNLVGVWPRNRIVWCGTISESDELQTLVNAIQQDSPVESMHSRKKKFKTHITLARKATRRVFERIEPIQFMADSISLVRSVPIEGGVRYEIVKQSMPKSWQSSDQSISVAEAVPNIPKSDTT